MCATRLRYAPILRFVMLPPAGVGSQTRPAAGAAPHGSAARVRPSARAARGAGRLLWPLGAALLAALLLGGCVAGQPGDAGPTRVWVLHVTVEPALYRVTVRWTGPPPAYRETLLLERAAKLAAQAGAATFFVVNASEPLAHPEWLAPQAVYSPTMVIPESEIPDGGALSALIRVFAQESPPGGLRLYDAQRILRDRKGGSGATRFPGGSGRPK